MRKFIFCMGDNIHHSLVTTDDRSDITLLHEWVNIDSDGRMTVFHHYIDNVIVLDYARNTFEPYSLAAEVIRKLKISH